MGPTARANSATQSEAPPGRQAPLNRADIAAMALLVAGVVAVFWKVLFTSDMLFYRDVFNYSYPHARFIQEACRKATLPYWNPYLNFGEPVLANPNFLFFYPSTLLLILFPIDFAYTLHYVFHFAVAGLGTFGLARRWGQSRAAALFAAFVFVFSGPVLSLGNFYNHAACATWIPWALLVTDLAIESQSLRPWLLLTLVFSLQFLASEPFTLFATFGLSLAYSLHRKGNLGQPLAGVNRLILGRFFLVGCLMVALCAVQFFPSLDLLQNARRGTEGLPYRETSTWPFHPLSLLEVILPDFFGPPATVQTLWTTVLSGRNLPYYPSVFVGFVPLFFALVGWAAGRDPRRVFLAGTTVTLLFLSFGRLTPAFALAYLLLPPLALVRFPVKLLVPALLLVALLAGSGLEAVRQERWASGGQRARVLRPLQALLASAVVAWLVSCIFPKWIDIPAAWILRRTYDLFPLITGGELHSDQVAAATAYFATLLRYYLPGLAGLVLGGMIWVLALERGKNAARRAAPIVAVLGVAQMAWVNYRANPTVPKAFYTYRPPVIAHLEESKGPFRVCSMCRERFSLVQSRRGEGFLNFDSVPETRGFSDLAQSSFQSRLLLERGSMLAGVETSLNVDIERSLPPYLYEFWIYALLQEPDPARTDCLFGRANVRYMILPTGQENRTSRPKAQIFNGSPQPSVLYENLCSVPRAYVAGRVCWSGSPLETLRRLSREDFDALHEVLVPAGGGTGPPCEGSGPAGTVEIIDRQANAVKLRAELDRPGYVVLLDRFDPNWHATVDGREVPVLRANQAFRAIRAEAGRHEVRFYYRQKDLVAGIMVSLATLALVTVLFALDPGRSRTSTTPLASRAS